MRPEVENNWPSTTTVRKVLPDIYDSESQKMKSSLEKKKVVIFADETTDTEQRYVLNVLIMELDAFKSCKPLLAETYFLDVSFNVFFMFIQNNSFFY